MLFVSDDTQSQKTPDHMTLAKAADYAVADSPYHEDAVDKNPAGLDKTAAVDIPNHDAAVGKNLASG
ncbi:hypothetical protein AXX17_AT5G36990 [Arabidopsis thaliana]|uniref:Uncharacterized protein n=1 Tax=Arabidopsis thaliana TaxID=3702 RepID=A0A178U908_ARATH|nr:hypothetical protein AXX17_AT5G36990 [Arabidopsis thaliana]